MATDTPAAAAAKPGWFSSEFALSVATLLLSAFAPAAAAMGPKTAAIIQGATAIAYTASRAYVKGKAAAADNAPTIADSPGATIVATPAANERR